MEKLLSSIADLLGTTVLVDLSEYDDKTIAENERNNLITLILADTELSYDGDKLRTQSDFALKYIKQVYPKRYQARLNELKNAQRNKENAD